MQEKIKEIALKVSSVARKKRLKGKELVLLREAKDELNRLMSEFKECQVCGNVVTELVKIEIGGSKVAACHNCGIELIKNPNLVRRKHRASHAQSKTSRVKETGKVASAQTAKKVRAKKERHPLGFFAARADKEVQEKEVQKKSPQISMDFESSLVGDSNNINFYEIADRHKINIGVLRKVYKILQSIAVPMSFEGTFQFVKSELSAETVKINDSELRSILSDFKKGTESKV